MTVIQDVRHHILLVHSFRVNLMVNQCHKYCTQYCIDNNDEYKLGPFQYAGQRGSTGLRVRTERERQASL